MRSLELKIPPVVVTLLIAGLMRIFVWVFPGFGYTFIQRSPFVAAFALAGFVVGALGIVSFRRARTTVNPVKVDSTSALVHSGVYQFTRNPMYLGLLMVLIAWAIHLSNTLTFVGPVLFVLYMNRFQIAPEERALASRYGKAYSEYQQHVRRWM